MRGDTQSALMMNNNAGVNSLPQINTNSQQIPSVNGVQQELQEFERLCNVLYVSTATNQVSEIWLKIEKGEARGGQTA